MSDTTAGHYFVPNPSIWPIVATIGLFVTMVGFVMFLNEVELGNYVLPTGLGILVFMMIGWFSTVVSESVGAKYGANVDRSFRMGMMWFIFSEVMFFAAFFGALFYARVLSVPWLADEPLLWGGYSGGWPTAGPQGETLLGTEVVAGEGEYSKIDTWHLPLWNTIILLISSVTCTIAHHALRAGHRFQLIFWLAVTVALGAIFLYFQATEYIHAYQSLGLTLGTGIYGATFFMLTGFHGLHVTIGAIILFFVLLRCMRGHFTAENHFAFEAGAWYWHFVDTVWVGLFIFVYIL